MQAHEERVVEEKKELDGKIIKLNEFILNSTTYQFLVVEDKTLLSRQLDAMVEYSKILQMRIYRFPK